MIFPLTEALLEAARKATPGPWKSNREGFAALSEDHTVAMRAGPHSLMVGSVMEAFSNVEFAVAARNAIPEIERLIAQLKAAEEVVDGINKLEGMQTYGWYAATHGAAHAYRLKYPASPSHQEGDTP